MHRRLLVVLIIAPVVAGCLVKDTTHRLYLSPDGAVEWTVLERDVRSSDSAPSERWREEQAYLDSLHAATHPVQEAFRQLSPSESSARLLRAERPYAMLANARFPRADVLVARLLEELGIPGSASLRQRGDEMTLAVAVDLSGLDDHDAEVQSPVVALAEDIARYRIVLTDGSFVSSEGFAIVDEGTAADVKPEHVPVDRPAQLRLTWKVR
jgi:hypothetical protein